MITIMGSGRVGSTVALNLIQRQLDDITLIDVIQGLPQGEALDLTQAATRYGSDVTIRGSNDYSDMAASDLVIIPAGLARKPGMTRLDLLHKNAEIVREISNQIAEHAPKALVLVVTNPLDAMTYVALKHTRFPKNHVFGMGGMLDVARFEAFLAERLQVSRTSVRGLVIGEHGENMVPLIRHSSVFGIPVTKFVRLEQRAEFVERTRKIAAEVIALKGATVYAPGAAVAEMVDAIKHDRKAVLPLSTYLDGEYGVRGLCIGVPAVLGANGVERIVELDLDEWERAEFVKGVETLRGAIAELEAKVAKV